MTGIFKDLEELAGLSASCKANSENLVNIMASLGSRHDDLVGVWNEIDWLMIE